METATKNEKKELLLFLWSIIFPVLFFILSVYFRNSLKGIWINRIFTNNLMNPFYVSIFFPIIFIYFMPMKLHEKIVVSIISCSITILLSYGILILFILHEIKT